MSSFTDKLTVTKINANQWQVEREFSYHVGSEESAEIITVEKGFITDFASVPRLFWQVLPPDGEYTQAAVLHDFLYLKKIYNRAKSDYIFLEAMKVLNVPTWKRLIMYYAVRIFAGLCWKRKDKI